MYTNFNIIPHFSIWIYATDEECVLLCTKSVVAERSDSSSGVVQNVGSNPGMAGHSACVLEQDT